MVQEQGDEALTAKFDALVDGSSGDALAKNIENALAETAGITVEVEMVGVEVFDPSLVDTTLQPTTGSSESYDYTYIIAGATLSTVGLLTIVSISYHHLRIRPISQTTQVGNFDEIITTTHADQDASEPDQDAPWPAMGGWPAPTGPPEFQI